ncbi:MAG: hypothetical protein ACK2U9_04055, partial [Anaerolineae bacterium]
APPLPRLGYHAGRMRRPLPQLCLLILAAGAAVPAAAGAHVQEQPFTTNRYLEVAFAAPGVLVRYNLSVGELPARELRARFDADGDERLDPAESARLQSWLLDRICRGLDLELDGARQSVRAERVQADLASDQVQMLAPIRLRFQVPLDCPPGAHRLVIHDRSALPAPGQTELAVRKADHVQLVRVARPGKDRGVNERLTWEKGVAPEPAWIDFRLEATAGAAAGTGPADRAAPADEAWGLKRVLLDRRLGLWGLLAALGLAL